MISQGEPLGGAFQSAGNESLFSLLSRGDRVRGRLAKPQRSGPHPLILISGPDGCARSPSVDAAIACWSTWAVVAAIDLPLCGARRSDKLLLPDLERDDSVVARVRADLERQVESDLERTLALLGGASQGLFGAGLGAELALPFCRNKPAQLRAIALAPASPVTIEESEHTRIFPANAPLQEIGEFLRARLL